VLFLFSIGVTKGKWGSLVNALLDFKRDYDANTRLARAMPVLAEANAAAYGSWGLRDLGQAMFTALRTGNMPLLLQQAYTAQPHAGCTPAAAYDRLVRGEGMRADLAGLAGGVAATAIVPYPPGIPLLMPGEMLGDAGGPVLQFLAALRDFDRQFPGFGHDTHGITADGGAYYGLRF
jgi:lysine decarboxylase/arginine decarboxylase